MTYDVRLDDPETGFVEVLKPDPDNSLKVLPDTVQIGPGKVELTWDPELAWVKEEYDKGLFPLDGFPAPEASA
jgi:hypothetical protein